MKIVTLTLSAAYDVHCTAHKIAVGEENHARVLRRDCGGKGVNISRALSAFDIDSMPIVILGKDNCDEYIIGMKSEGLEVRKIIVSGRIRENITVHADDGTETRLSFSCDKLPRDILRSVESITDEALGEGDVFTFTGSIPDGIYISEAKSFIGRLSKRGVKVIVDSRSFSATDIADIKPYLIKPNAQEVKAYLKREIRNEADAMLGAEELRCLGIKNVMITLGAGGAVLASDEGSFSMFAPEINAVSTIGAGDSAIAGFIYAESLGLSKSEALKAAVAFGTAKCLLEGTKPPCKEDVEKFL